MNQLVLFNQPTTKLSVDTASDLFALFWSIYPKRPNNPKKPAFEKFINLTTKGCSCKMCRGKKHDPREIIEGTKRYAESVRDTDPKYVKMATTFLNTHSWNCETVIPRANTMLGILEELRSDMAAENGYDHDPSGFGR